MKFGKIILGFVLALGISTSYAQTTKTTSTKTTATKSAKTTAITDEDLRKYAITMDSVKVMQETLTQIITENVQKNTVMSVSRYNEIFKIASDQAKLAAANATPDEIAFLKELDSLKAYNLERINTTYKELAKDYVGLKAFNSIRKSLESDPALKQRFETISQEVASGNKPADPASKESGE